MVYRAHGCNIKWYPFTIPYYAGIGNLACIKYCRENGCPWGIFARIMAIENSHRDCDEYLENNGCKLDLIEIIELGKRGIEPYKSMMDTPPYCGLKARKRLLK